MQVGDLKDLQVKILGVRDGEPDIDVMNTDGLTLAELNIFEDIHSPTGPFADLKLIDGANIIDRAVLTGNEPVSISFVSNDFPDVRATFDMSMMKGVDYMHGSSGGDGEGGGSLYHKTYTFKLCSPEYVQAQGNYVNREYEDLCSNIVADIVANYFKSDKGCSLPDPTQFIRRMIARFEHPLKFLDRVIDDSVSSHPCSLYVLYCTRSNGGQYFVYETYENAFTRDTGITLKLRNTLKTSGTTNIDKIFSLMWLHGEAAFYRPSRPQNKSYAIAYNMATGKLERLGGDDVGTPFNVLGQYIYKRAPDGVTGVPIFVTISAENNPADFALARAKILRSAFQSQLIQNEVSFENIGNPNLILGSVVTLNVPDMWASDERIEQQLAGKFLITAIRHKISGMNMTPGYTTVIKGVKAAFNLQGDTPG